MKDNFDIEHLIKFTNGELPVAESMLIRQEMENDAFLQQIIEGIRIDELVSNEESLADFISRSGSEFKAELFDNNVTAPDNTPSAAANGSQGFVGYTLGALAVAGLLTFGGKMAYDNFTAPEVTTNINTEIPALEIPEEKPEESISVVVVEKSDDADQQATAPVKEDFKLVKVDEKDLDETKVIGEQEQKVNYRVSVSTTKKENGEQRRTAEVFIEDETTDNVAAVAAEPTEAVEVQSKSYSVTVNDAEGQEEEMDITINSTKKEHDNAACPTTIYLINSLPRGTYQANAVITSNSRIKEGKNVTFISGESITLEAPFEVQKNATFEAVILQCGEEHNKDEKEQ